jgi:leucyl aminopeptidase (aminopeptidase T)
VVATNNEEIMSMKENSLMKYRKWRLAAKAKAAKPSALAGAAASHQRNGPRWRYQRGWRRKRSGMKAAAGIRAKKHTSWLRWCVVFRILSSKLSRQAPSVAKTAQLVGIKEYRATQDVINK